MEFIIQDALKNAEENFNVEDLQVGKANMKVIGVGGAGSNIASWLYKKGINGAEVIVANTDKQHLDISQADRNLLLGRELTRGLGCGGYLEKGRESAKESMQELREIVKGTDMVFVAAGMGGGTGTGAAPVIAQLAKETGAIVIAVVTMPFDIEKARCDKAEFGLQQLREVCDTVIVLDNNRLSTVAGQLPLQQAFAVANELLSTMIKSIVEIIALPSLVNLDYADVKTIMKEGGVSVIGVGESGSENKVTEAVNRALSNPLLDVSYEGATGALIHITGGADMLLDDVEQVGKTVTKTLDPDAMVIWGAHIDPNMEGKIRVMTIITGVSSPYILGKIDRTQLQAEKATQIGQELGIDMLK
ncbi:cell division protein FtsZ [archaeon]|nr:cell division protein FtsZ [archaeon]